MLTAVATPDRGMDYRVLVSGWRHWPVRDIWLVHHSLELIRGRVPLGTRMMVVDGACPYGGVDLFAHQWTIHAAELGWNVVSERHEANFRAWGPSAGPARNQFMVSQGANEALVFPGPGSKGTIGCLKLIIDANIPVQVFAHSEVAMDRMHMERFGRLRP